MVDASEESCRSILMRLERSCFQLMVFLVCLDIYGAPPTFDSEPVSQERIEGGWARFSALARGTEPLRYQWFFEGAELLYQTNSTYIIRYLETNMAGRYHVRIANQTGTNFSSNAFLTVVAISTVRPRNDAFESAIIIAAGETVQSDNYGASSQVGEPFHCGSRAFKTVWYRWTPPHNGLARVRVEDADFDTVLSVYTGDAVDRLAEVAANDDQIGLNSGVQFLAYAGMTYHLALSGYAFREGAFTFRIQQSPEVDLQNSRLVIRRRQLPDRTELQLTGTAGELQRIEYSSDLNEWHAFTNATVQGDGTTLEVSIDEAFRFYRALPKSNIGRIQTHLFYGDLGYLAKPHPLLFVTESLRSISTQGPAAGFFARTGTQRVRLVQPGFAAGEVDVVVEDGKTNDVDLILSSRLLPESATLVCEQCMGNVLPLPLTNLVFRFTSDVGSSVILTEFMQIEALDVSSGGLTNLKHMFQLSPEGSVSGTHLSDLTQFLGGIGDDVALSISGRDTNGLLYAGTILLRPAPLNVKVTLLPPASLPNIALNNADVQARTTLGKRIVKAKTDANGIAVLRLPYGDIDLQATLLDSNLTYSAFLSAELRSNSFIQLQLVGKPDLGLPLTRSASTERAAMAMSASGWDPPLTADFSISDYPASAREGQVEFLIPPGTKEVFLRHSGTEPSIYPRPPRYEYSVTTANGEVLAHEAWTGPRLVAEHISCLQPLATGGCFDLTDTS